MRRILLLLLWALGSCPSAPLRAEFILDDFDDPASTASPEMLGDILVTTDVGQLLAERELRIAATASGSRAPIATLDTSFADQGIMTADLQKVGTTQGGNSPIFAFQFNYIFLPTDVSEGGANNAVFFDFSSIAGTESPIFLRAIVTDDTFVSHRFQAHVLDLPTSSGAFTAVMPFSSFTIRGGAPGLPDFTTFKRMDFDFFFLFPSLDIQWSAKLDRIRFGQVPEPSAVVLAFFGCIAQVVFRQRICR